MARRSKTKQRAQEDSRACSSKTASKHPSSVQSSNSAEYHTADEDHGMSESSCSVGSFATAASRTFPEPNDNAESHAVTATLLLSQRPNHTSSTGEVEPQRDQSSPSLRRLSLTTTTSVHTLQSTRDHLEAVGNSHARSETSSSELTGDAEKVHSSGTSSAQNIDDVARKLPRSRADTNYSSSTDTHRDSKGSNQHKWFNKQVERCTSCQKTGHSSKSCFRRSQRRNTDAAKRGDENTTYTAHTTFSSDHHASALENCKCGRREAHEATQCWRNFYAEQTSVESHAPLRRRHTDGLSYDNGGPSRYDQYIAASYLVRQTAASRTSGITQRSWPSPFDPQNQYTRTQWQHNNPSCQSPRQDDGMSLNRTGVYAPALSTNVREQFPQRPASLQMGRETSSTLPLQDMTLLQWFLTIQIFHFTDPAIDTLAWYREQARRVLRFEMLQRCGMAIVQTNSGGEAVEVMAIVSACCREALQLVRNAIAEMKLTYGLDEQDLGEEGVVWYVGEHENVWDRDRIVYQQSWERIVGLSLFRWAELARCADDVRQMSEAEVRKFALDMKEDE